MAEHTLTIACPNCGDPVDLSVKVGALFCHPKSIRGANLEAAAAHTCPALAPKRRPSKPKGADHV